MIASGAFQLDRNKITKAETNPPTIGHAIPSVMGRDPDSLVLKLDKDGELMHSVQAALDGSLDTDPFADWNDGAWFEIKNVVEIEHGVRVDLVLRNHEKETTPKGAGQRPGHRHLPRNWQRRAWRAPQNRVSTSTRDLDDRRRHAVH